MKLNMFTGGMDQSTSSVSKSRFIQDSLPTPRRSDEFDGILIEIINDGDKFYAFENYLQESKNYDLDNLEFYIKVMEFKKESDSD